MARQFYDEDTAGKRFNRGRFPMDKLKRVDQPTIRITDNVPRHDERDHGWFRARIGELGPAVAREYARCIPKYPLSAVQAKMTASLASMVDGEAAAAKAPIPEDAKTLSSHIKRLGYFLRADIMGICELPQYAVYSHNREGTPVELNHKYAIMIVIDQDYETMRGSTGHDWISGSQSFISYSNSAFIACIMADYIRKLGYPARAHHATNYQVILPPLLLQAGIGEFSRSGIVLNPFLGTRFKASVVTTDLPLVPDKPVDFGLQEFCRKCLKCAVECPSNAISRDDKVLHNGYEHWKFDSDRCSRYRCINQGGSACGRCIKVCPWNKPEGRLHDMVRWMVKYTPFMDSFIIKMDDVWGYNKQDKRYKWWFDVEEVDGVLKIPDKTSD